MADAEVRDGWCPAGGDTPGTWLEQDSEALESPYHKVWPYFMTDSPAMVQTVKNLPACRRLRLDP